MGKRVLVIEDEKAIVDILKFNLKREGYDAVVAYDGDAGLRMAREQKPDIILLDVMLPLKDGFSVCRELREQGDTVPIIILTARETEVDKVFGLEIGADDYITKPFSMRELLARVKANIRRQVMEETKGEDEVKNLGELKINPRNNEVLRSGKPVDLSTREFDLLNFLAASPDTVFTREELMERVWNYDYVGDVRTVDVAVRRLREKLERDPAEPAYIITKRGLGYYFAAQE